MGVIDLSNSMKARIRNWHQLGHQVDDELLLQCAYYPRGGCQDCSFDNPLSSCQWSHILIDTRIGFEPRPYKVLIRSQQTPSQSPSPNKNKKKTAWGLDVERIFNKLPKAVQEEFERLLPRENW